MIRLCPSFSLKLLVAEGEEMALRDGHNGGGLQIGDFLRVPGNIHRMLA